MNLLMETIFAHGPQSEMPKNTVKWNQELENGVLCKELFQEIKLECFPTQLHAVMHSRSDQQRKLLKWLDLITKKQLGWSLGVGGKFLVTPTTPIVYPDP